MKLLEKILANSKNQWKAGDKVRFKKDTKGYYAPYAGKEFTIEEFIPRNKVGDEREDAAAVKLKELKMDEPNHLIKVWSLEKVKATVEADMSLLNKVLSAGKAEAHCYTTWHEGLRKLEEAQTVFNKAMGMAATESLPYEMKAQLSQLVSDVYNLQANAHELFEELREVDAGAPPPPKEEEEKAESSVTSSKKDDVVGFIKEQVNIDITPLIDAKWSNNKHLTLDWDKLSAADQNKIKSLAHGQGSKHFRLEDNGGLGKALIFN